MEYFWIFVAIIIYFTLHYIFARDEKLQFTEHDISPDDKEYQKKVFAESSKSIIHAQRNTLKFITKINSTDAIEYRVSGDTLYIYLPERLFFNVNPKTFWPAIYKFGCLYAYEKVDSKFKFKYAIALGFYNFFILFFSGLLLLDASLKHDGATNNGAIKKYVKPALVGLSLGALVYYRKSVLNKARISIKKSLKKDLLTKASKHLTEEERDIILHCHRDKMVEFRVENEAFHNQAISDYEKEGLDLYKVTTLAGYLGVELTEQSTA